MVKEMGVRDVIISLLAGALLFLVGGALGTWSAYGAIADVREEVVEHIGLPAHPVTEVQYQFILEELSEIKASQVRMETRIDTLTVHHED